MGSCVTGKKAWVVGVTGKKAWVVGVTGKKAWVVVSLVRKHG